MNIVIEAESHIGKVRDENQDAMAWKIHPSYPVAYFIVADGMGGYSGGALASQIAVESIEKAMLNCPYDQLNTADAAEIDRLLGHHIDSSIRFANTAIWDRKSDMSPEFGQMGTTIVLGIICHNRLVIGHVGDSRAYLYRSNSLSQLTKDHSVLQELINSGVENVDSMNIRDALTRALGIQDTVEPELGAFALQTGDVILSCSDGLTKHLSDGQIGHELSLNLSINDTCFRLLDLALSDGGKDNITLVLSMIGT